MALCIRVELKGKNCGIFGGGKEGFRRAEQLLEQGATVVAYSPQFCKEWQNSKVVCVQQPYNSSQLKGMFLVAAATNDTAVNEQIVADCMERRILVISSTQTDTPFHPMANRSWGNGIVAVSVPKAPSLAPQIATELASQAQNQYAKQAEQMGLLRQLAQKTLPCQQARQLMRQAAQMSTQQLEKIIAEMQEEHKTE